MTITNNMSYDWTKGFIIPAGQSITLSVRQMITFQKNCGAFMAAYKKGSLSFSGK